MKEHILRFEPSSRSRDAVVKSNVVGVSKAPQHYTWQLDTAKVRVRIMRVIFENTRFEVIRAGEDAPPTLPRCCAVIHGSSGFFTKHGQWERPTSFSSTQERRIFLSPLQRQTNTNANTEIPAGCHSQSYCFKKNEECTSQVKLLAAVATLKRPLKRKFFFF